MNRDTTATAIATAATTATVATQPANAKPANAKAQPIAADLSPRAYQQAAQFLSGLDEDWARHIAAVGPCQHAAKPAREPYEALVRAIAYQQLHAKAGDAILGRLLALYADEPGAAPAHSHPNSHSNSDPRQPASLRQQPSLRAAPVAKSSTGSSAGSSANSSPASAFPSPAQLLATDPEAQRACGFSAAKLATIRGIAQATLDGVVPSLQAARQLTDEVLIERLSALRGVGRWTVEMFLIYSLERSDILPVDDLGVRAGYARLKGLSKPPTPRQMRDMGQAWRPHRTVATWYLWRLPAR